MKPKDLPFYDVVVEKSEEIIKEATPGLLEEKVSKARVFIEDNTKPLQSAVSTVSSAGRNLKERGCQLYSRINQPDTLFNCSVIGGSAVSGWMLNALFFRKSGRLQRMVAPLVFGSVAAAYLYPDSALAVGKDSYQFGKTKFFQLKDKVSGKN